MNTETNVTKSEKAANYECKKHHDYISYIERTYNTNKNGPGRMTKMMKKQKYRSWDNAPEDKGTVYTEKSKTMPDMHTDPRTVIENHIRGINP